MDYDDEAKPLDELLEPGSTLMLAVDTVGPLEFRPMTVARTGGSSIEMLLDTEEEWARSLSNGDRAYVTLSDNRTNTWMTMRGRTSVSTDPATIDELWNPAADAYFDDGRDSPGIAVLRVTGENGRYWSSPSGRLGSVVSFVKAKLGDPEDTGEHGDVEL
jgi:general stress protein 26